MTEFDKKILDNFPGKAVRKDLTSIMKKGANVPTYVLEYLLGMYCATDDDDAIEAGLVRIKKILSENYVRPDMSEYIKSRIKEQGHYTIIDKISVEYNEHLDTYIAHFTNFNAGALEIAPDFVVNNEKLLVGGIWAIMKMEYIGLNNQREETQSYLLKDDTVYVTANKKKNKSPFAIATLKPIQMPSLNLNEIKEARYNFTKDEWISLLLSSSGS